MAIEKGEVTLFKTFYRKLECRANGVRNAIKEKREFLSYSDMMILMSLYQNETCSSKTYITVEIRYTPCFKNICDSKDDFFFINTCSLGQYIFSKTPIKQPSIHSVAMKNHKGEEEIVNICDICYLQSTILFSVEITENILSYVTENDEMTIVIDFNLYAYHFVEDTTLQDLCYANLSLNLTKENVFDILHIADVYIMKDLVDQCIEIIKRHFKELCETEKFKTLKDDIKNMTAGGNYVHYEDLVLDESDESEDEENLDP